MSTEPAVHPYVIRLCDLCVVGAGGICNVPGCSMFHRTSPDIELQLGAELELASDYVGRIGTLEPSDETVTRLSTTSAPPSPASSMPTVADRCTQTAPSTATRRDVARENCSAERRRSVDDDALRALAEGFRDNDWEAGRLARGVLRLLEERDAALGERRALRVERDELARWRASAAALLGACQCTIRAQIAAATKS